MAHSLSLFFIAVILQKHKASLGCALTVPLEESLTMPLSCSKITVKYSFSWLIA